MQIKSMDSYIQLGSDLIPYRMPIVMGILNLTPDSFFDGGKHQQMDQALFQAQKMLDAGALVLDLGGESTRPGAQEVGIQEELDRVLPVVEKIQQEFKGRSFYLSVDTVKPEVALAALKQGVQIINDISALRNPAMFQVVCEYPCSVVLNHMQGNPRTMQLSPVYSDVIAEVSTELHHTAQNLLDHGKIPAQILLDPGIGFGKNLAHNLSLIQGIQELGKCGYPTFLGVSRKSFIGKIPNLSSSNRLIPSVATALWAAENHVAMVRVHDVQETVEAFALWSALKYGVSND